MSTQILSSKTKKRLILFFSALFSLFVIIKMKIETKKNETSNKKNRGKLRVNYHQSTSDHVEICGGCGGGV